MLRIYHAPGTRSVRPLWLCYELGLAPEVVTVDLSAEHRDSPAWRAISPAGKVPALQDDGLTMIESGAMVDYILDRYGDGRLRPPAGTAARALHQQWCWFSEASLLRPLGLARALRGGDDLAGEALAKAREALAVVDHALQDRAYLLGDDFTGADVMMGYALLLLEHHRLLDPAAQPEITRYVERLRPREALVRAMKR
jgi:glutathione S-transferase